MTAYYNEFDPKAAAWLRSLIKAGLIPDGVVDDRSILDVKPEDLRGFNQVHFFAGIGGWPLALRLAGISDDTPVWTGSPPCQPFSVAGQKLGFSDPRHLAPHFLDLVAECRPAVLFGEQVAAAIKPGWLDFVSTDLEAEGYAFGSAVLPACSVGAPHKRERLFFGAIDAVALAELHGLADRERAGSQGGLPGWANPQREALDGHAGCGRAADGMDDTACERREGERLQQVGGDDYPEAPWVGKISPAVSHNSFWAAADWLGCRDGKLRPVEPGSFPLVDGISGRMVKLRGYGNAIVPPLAAEFITAFLDAALGNVWAR